MFGCSRTYLYDIEHDKYQAFINYNEQLSTPKHHFFRYGRSYVVDTANHLMYIYLSNYDNSMHIMTTLNIKDISNIIVVDETSIPIPEDNDTRSIHARPSPFDCHHMCLVGNKIHGIFAKSKQLTFEYFIFDIKNKTMTLIHKNLEQTYLDNITFDHVYDFSDDNINCNKNSTSDTSHNYNPWDDGNNLNFDIYINKESGESKWKINFLNSLKTGSKIDCKDITQNTPYYCSVIVQLVHKDKRHEWNKKCPLVPIKFHRLRYRHKMDTEDIYDNYEKFALIHYIGWREKHDEWIGLNKDEICDCKHKCDNISHQFGLPVTQSSFRIKKKGRRIIYSQKHKKLMVIGRDFGLSCYTHVNHEWYDYLNTFDLNGNQSYYNYNCQKALNRSHSTTTQTIDMDLNNMNDLDWEPPRKRRRVCLHSVETGLTKDAKLSVKDNIRNIKIDEAEIEKHFFELVTIGFLRKCETQFKIKMHAGLYNVILKYYFKPSNFEWIFVKNAKIPLTCNSACVLLNNDNDVIILGHANRENRSNGIIYKYDIDKDEVSQINHIQTPEHSKHIHAVYSLQKKRIYLFDLDYTDYTNGKEIHSIKLSSILPEQN